MDSLGCCCFCYPRMRSSSLMSMVVVVEVLIMAVVMIPGAQGLSLTSCPIYVLEGSNLSCTCAGDSSQASITWPGYSNTSTLTLTSVQRGDNTHYVCRSELNGQTSNISYDLQVAYGPASASISGPDFVIADGIRELNLTCTANEVNPSAMFLWYTPDPNRRCSTPFSQDICTYRPEPVDEGKAVTCRASNSFVGASGIQATKSYTLNLMYPPPEMPIISMASSQTVPLRQGDVITCTVSGGKPRVTSVTFYCRKPDIADEEDEVSADGRTVRSSVVVNTTEADVDNTTCHCKANWGLEPRLYSGTTTMDFLLQYKARVANFTVNGVSELIVQESNRPTAQFLCSGAGRPAPQLRLLKRGSDTELKETADIATGTGTGTTSSSGSSSGSPPSHQPVELVYTISNVVCEDMGHYACLADNGFSDPIRLMTRLLVYCGPRLLNAPPSTSPTPVLTSQGLTFAVVAYPTPAVETVYFLGNNVNNNNNNEATTNSINNNNNNSSDVTSSPGEPVKDGAFEQTFRRNSSLEHVVHVTVRPVDVPQDKTGEYRLVLANRLGSLTLRFVIDSPVIPPPDKSPSTTLIIVLSVVGGMILVLIVVVIINFRRRKTKQDRRKINDNQAMDMNTPGKHRGTGSPPGRSTPAMTTVENGSQFSRPALTAQTGAPPAGRTGGKEDPGKVTDSSPPTTGSAAAGNNGRKMEDEAESHRNAYDCIAFVNEYDNVAANNDVDADGYAYVRNGASSSSSVKREPPTSPAPEVPTSSVSGSGSDVASASQPGNRTVNPGGDIYATIDPNRRGGNSVSRPAGEATGEKVRTYFAVADQSKSEDTEQSATPPGPLDHRAPGTQPETQPTKKHVTTISVGK